MERWIARITALIVLFLLVAAAFGVQTNSHAKFADMPADIKYQILAKAGIWPDNFYASAYSSPQARSFYLNGYWTFEHGTHPFAGPMWVYHTNELTINDTDFVVNTITRTS